VRGESTDMDVSGAIILRDRLAARKHLFPRVAASVATVNAELPLAAWTAGEPLGSEPPAPPDGGFDPEERASAS
jgi:hypothetical protein